MADRWGLLREGNTVHEITDIDPAGRFPPDMRWVKVPDNAVEGATFIEHSASVVNPIPGPPAEVIPPSPPNMVMSKLQFFSLFTIPEEAALEASTDTVVVVSLRRLNAAQTVDLGDKQTVELVTYLGNSGALTADRVGQILSGKEPPLTLPTAAPKSA